MLGNVGEVTIPRLFHGSNASGTFKSTRVKLISDFKTITIKVFFSGRGAEFYTVGFSDGGRDDP